MRSHKKRLERLERARPKGFPIVIVEPGETWEEAWQKHLAKHPEDEKAEFRFILDSLSNQAASSGPPTPRPQPPKRPGAAGTRPLQITK
jgi:hypothetical protein